MERRNFMRLVAGAVVVLPIGTFLLSCGEGEEEYGVPDSDAPATPPRIDGTAAVYTTNLRGDHAHQVSIERDSFSQPPADGVSGSTSIAEGHQHSFAVSMQMLASVQTGQTVKINTGATEAHTHVVTLVKLG